MSEGGDTWVGLKHLGGGQDMLLGVWIGLKHVGGGWNLLLGRSKHMGGVKTPPSHALSKGGVWW
jgi:hypothetical protein